jgi:steroid 5-alpha reductase family enzyme
MWFISQKNPEINVLDVIGIVMCIGGITFAYFADTQLFNFVSRNQFLVHNKKKPVLLLNTGVWSVSRHPNHFGMKILKIFVFFIFLKKI